MTRVIYSVVGQKVARPERFEVQVFYGGAWRGVLGYKKRKLAIILADILAYAFEGVRVEDLGV